MAIALVTGGSGYFGSLVVRQLLDLGFDVRVFDLLPGHDWLDGVKLIQGDIRDYGAIRRACEGVEVVHHNVAQVPLAKDKRLFWSVNVAGTDNLLQAALQSGVCKVIYVSSSAVFGVPPRNPVDDSVAPNPEEDYGRAKLKAEELVRRYVERGLDATIIRPRTVLGHGRLGIFQILFEWIFEGRSVYVLGRGDNRYQFVHADDLADACLRAAERPGFAVYNIGAERFCSMRQTLEGLIAHAGTNSRVRSIPFRLGVALMNVTSWLGLSPLGPYHSLMYGQEMFFDLSKAKKELGWQPKWGNIEMFCQSYDWYLEHREEILKRCGDSPHRSVVRPGLLTLLKHIS